MKNTINFLEELAHNTHYSIDTRKLIQTQSDKIKKAFLLNNSELLRREIDDNVYIGSPSDVTQI